MMALFSSSTQQLSAQERAELRARLRAGTLSLVIGSLLLGAKFLAFELTGSVAVFSDAMESIVNVVAAIFAIGGLLFAGRPADRNHPYGHGKIEFFSGAFEGGLITFAAVMIVYGSIDSLIRDVQLRQIDLGLAITAGAGVINLLLGLFLVRVGSHHDSLTLIADGKHVISDFWTSAGVVLGLFLVRITGLAWIDPLVAVFVGINLAFTGIRLVRYAAGGLLDEEDSTLLTKLVAAMNAKVGPGIIRVHNLRAIRSGRYTHIDAHLVVPEFWTVERAHDVANDFERGVIEASAILGEIVFHTDPCRRLYCARCDTPECPIRLEHFQGRSEMTVDEIVEPDPIRSVENSTRTQAPQRQTTDPESGK